MGLYQKTAHSRSLKYRMSDHITIAFHNLSSHDAHLFIKELGKKFNKDDVGVTAENNEKFIGFNVKIDVDLSTVTNEDGKVLRRNIQLSVIDRGFIASNLDKLDSNLNDDQCRNLRFLQGRQRF